MRWDNTSTFCNATQRLNTKTRRITKKSTKKATFYWPSLRALRAFESPSLCRFGFASAGGINIIVRHGTSGGHSLHGRLTATGRGLADAAHPADRLLLDRSTLLRVRLCHGHSLGRIGGVQIRADLLG